MPAFEFSYGGHQRTQAGDEPGIPPPELLEAVGPVIQVAVGPTPQFVRQRETEGLDPVAAVVGLALIDTGANVSAVDERLCISMGLNPIGTIKMAHADGLTDRLCYRVQITVQGATLPPLISSRTASVDFSSGRQPYIMLLGRDLLRHLRLVYNGPMGRIEIYS